MKFSRIVFFHVFAILFSLLNFGCAATSADMPNTAGRDLLLTEGTARVDLWEIATDVQPWVVVKVTLNTHGDAARAEAELVTSLDNSQHRPSAKKFTIAWKDPATDPKGLIAPIELSQQRGGVYLCKLNAANEIEVPSLRMIPDDWADKIKPALDYQAANPSVMRTDNVFKPETLITLLDNPNPLLSLQAWRILCTGEPANEIIKHQLSKSRGVLQGASLMILANLAASRQIDFRHGVRPAIENAAIANDVYGLTLGCWALPPTIYTNDIAAKVLAKPALIDPATPAGRTNRAVMEKVKATPGKEINARTPAS